MIRLASSARLKTALLVSVLIGGAAAAHVSYRIARIGTGYKAKFLCSGVFVSGREPASLLTQDLTVVSHGILRLFSSSIDREERTVRSTALLGLVSKEAVYRPGLGCALALDVSPDELRAQALPPSAHPALPDDSPWLTKRPGTPPRHPQAALDRLDAVISEAFAETDRERPRRTRAILVASSGKIIGERYAAGFSRETRLIGWSMTKSVINALVGILVKDGRLTLESSPVLKEWAGPQDPRRNISLDHLLRMSSGLDFKELYTPFSDVTAMLFDRKSSADTGIIKRAKAEPGAHWEYSSGTTNIISRIIREAIGSEKKYHAFPRDSLFSPVGMTSAVIETDPSGDFVGSSFMYATARDWARFGQLYLQDGIWDGRRLLPEGWVRYSAAPAPASVKKDYGAHFWLRFPGQEERGPALPADMMMALGHHEQSIVIIPSKGLVIVRLGLTADESAWDGAAFVSRVIAALDAK